MHEIRKAVIGDLSQITEIYNEAILNTTATFDTEKKSLEEQTIWFFNRDDNFPILVYVLESKIIGFAALNKWSDKKAYDITAEVSIYINPKNKNQGIGTLLLNDLIKESIGNSINSIIARITRGNDISVYVFEKNGFEIIGTIKQAGKKFGNLWDVILMQKIINQ